MKNIVLISLLLIICIPSYGGTDPALQELLVSSRQQANLFEDKIQPYQLEVDFNVKQATSLQGHLTWRWKAKDHWWRKIVMGSFVQIDVRNGDKLYISRNADFTPIRIRELIDLLQFADDAGISTAKKRKERSEHGLKLICLQIERGEPKWKHELYLDSSTHDILSDKWIEQVQEWRAEDFADYIDFAGRRYPQKLRLQVNGSDVVTASVQSLTVSDFDESLLVAPKGAIERRQCANLKHAVLIDEPDPQYPGSRSEESIPGESIVSITILTDGSVGEVHLTGSTTPAMDKATIEAVKKWKFRPAMCGAEPVVWDTQVEVRYSF